MAIAGTNSTFSIGKQPSVGVKAASAWAVDAIAPQFAVADNVRMRRPHIGSSPFMRGAYKVGVGVALGAAFEATPNITGLALRLALGHSLTGRWYRVVLSAGNVTSFRLDLGTFVNPTFTTGVKSSIITVANLTPDIVETSMAPCVASGPANGGRVIVTRISSTEYYVGVVGVAGSVNEMLQGSDVVGGGTVTVTKVAGGSAHLVTMAADKYALPWFTAWRTVGNQFSEIALDGKVATLNLAMAGGQAVNAQFAGAALTPHKVGVGAVNYTSPAPSTDILPLLTVMDGAHVDLTIDNVKYTTGNVAGESQLNVMSAGFSLNNNLTPIDTRYRIGSNTPVSLDVLSRESAIQMAVELENDDLYDKLTYDPTSGDWNEAVLEGNVRVASVTDAFGSEVAKSVEMIARSVFFSGMMVPVVPRRLVYGELTAGVISRTDVNNEIEFYVFNEDSTLST